VFHIGFKACNEYVGGEAAMAAVQCPVLFLLGKSDQMTPLRATQALLAKARGARVVHVAAGHALMSEAPDQVLFALRDFLGG
jgi:pimeloyl-ACP methyl ester carboxylesterase